MIEPGSDRELLAKQAWPAFMAASREQRAVLLEQAKATLGTRLYFERLPLYPRQAAIVDDPSRFTITEATTKAGKAQPLDAIVWTPTGPELMGSLRSGDSVLTPNGRAKIESIHPQGEKPIYKITFSDGSSCESTADHLWEVHADRRDGRRRFYQRERDGLLTKARRSDRIGWPRVMTLEKLMSYSERALKRMWVQVAQPVQFESREVPLHPYLIGALLGDGGMTGRAVMLSTTDEHILHRVEAMLPAGYSVKARGGCDYNLCASRSDAVRASWAGRRGENEASLAGILRAVGIMGSGSAEKHIPDDYKYNAIDKRWELLRGLMDTDGSVDKHGQPSFDTVSPVLARDVCELVESLGGMCKIGFKAKNHYLLDGVRHSGLPVYRLRITHADASLFFSLPRKKVATRPKSRQVKRCFRSIEMIGVKNAQCIKLNDPRGLYLTDRFIVTHNTASHIEWLLGEAIAANEGHHWWVAQISDVADIAFRRAEQRLRGFIDSGGVLQRRFEPIPFTINQTRKFIKINGATIWFKGADKPDSLFGEDVRNVACDEVSRWKEQSWHAVYSTLTATKGRAKLIGNVKGRRNFAYKLARKAEAGEPDWGYHKLTAYDAIEGGVIDAEIVEQARRDLPPDVFKELYEAAAGDDVGNPFGLAAIASRIVPLSTDPPVAYGIDLAKSIDWTVAIGLDAHGRVCRFDRWQGSWEVTQERLRAMVGRVPASVDSTGVGDPIVENLQKNGGSNFQGFKFSQSSKQQLMEGLAVAIHQGHVGYPDGPIVSELEAFEYEYTRTGVRYSAPSGVHDDCVCALALAVQLRGKPQGLTMIRPLVA